MFHKLTAFCLAVLLLQICLSSASAQTSDAQTAKVKAQIAKRGTGDKAKVKIELRDKTKVKGYISQSGEDEFTVTDLKTQAQTKIAYRDVAQVKGWGLSRGAKIAIIATAGLAVAVLVVVIAIRNFDLSGPFNIPIVQ